MGGIPDGGVESLEGGREQGTDLGARMCPQHLSGSCDQESTFPRGEKRLGPSMRGLLVKMRMAA